MFDKIYVLIKPKPGINGSDYDAMFHCLFICVYESLNAVHSEKDKVILHMDTNDTKSGFTKLKLVSNWSIHD